MILEELCITDKRLGTDSFGTVFVGQLGGIKVAAKKLSQSEREFDNLIREASKLKRLRHGKHITYIYGITLKDRNPYMVMEYSEQGDLQNYLKKNKESVTYEQRILFCRGILLGLLYCHSMKVFHGDIKCSNVILGKNLESKLTSFGLSMTVDNIEFYSKLHRGSLHWTAPELFSIRNEAVYQEFIADPYPCDVYSLGTAFCEISYDGTTEFIDSDEPAQDIVLGLIYPTPKDTFLEEIINGCCQFERDKRISLDECLYMLDNVAEEQFLVPTIDEKWQGIQQNILANLKLESPPSFILYRPAKNLVVGPSNLSLLEWLCINDGVEAVEYMFQLHNPEKKQLEWLCAISILCKSSNTVRLLQDILQNSRIMSPKLSDLADESPWQLIESLIKAGADCNSYSLLKKAIEKHYNIVVQVIVDNGIYLNDWFVHEAIKADNTEAVRIFAIAGIGLEHIDKNGNTPLLLAIDTGNIEVVKFLLDFSFNVNSQNHHTLLYKAALNGNKEIATILINAGATADTESEQWQILLQNPKSEGSRSTAQFIIDNMGEKDINSMEESTMLCTAIRNGQPDFVEDLIYNKVDVNERDYNGFTPLHWAVIIGNENIVTTLIMAGADIETKTPNKDQYTISSSKLFDEYTPLHIAIETKYLGIARLLIGMGADFSKRNGSGQTIMEVAADSDKKDIENIILEYVWISKDSFRSTLLSIGPEAVKKLIDRQEVDNDLLSDCLCVAVNYGNKEIVEYLIGCGADINWICEDKNLLEWAILGNQVQIVQILIEKNIDVNVRNSYDRTPLFLCVKESQIEIMQILLNRGAYVNIRDAYRDAPIHFVRDIEVGEILIGAGAEIDAIGRYNETALIRCVEKSQIKMLKFLIEKGANVNIKNSYEKAPIFLAKNREVVEILVKAGADINAKNRNGRTPLFQFVEKSHTDVLKLLIEKGANINARDNGGNAPIHFARTREIAEILIDNGADIKAKDEYGRQLSTILVQEQNKNLSRAEYKKVEVSYLQDFLALK